MNFKFHRADWRNLYLHIPFCATKCGYCAFYSETQSSIALRSNYLNAVQSYLEQCDFPQDISSVYIGGGTPNMLNFREMAALFECVKRLVPLSQDCEISCELNPECLTESKMSVLNEFATRVSLGVQSFDPQVREKLMRRCREEHLLRALKLLRKRRMKHFNIDLIYGVSGVSWQTFAEDLLRARDEDIDHISCYALTAEENSLLGLQAPVAEDAMAADWWLQIGEFLSACNIKRYEISNYAVPGSECQHNLNVWRGETLLGLGAAAAGFDGCDRYTFPESAEAFIAGAAPEIDHVPDVVRMLEIFAVNLRTVQGWRQAEWEKLYPASWEKLFSLCRNAAEKNPGWWICETDKIALSENGLLFWDEAAMEIIDWEEKLKNEI